MKTLIVAALAGAAAAPALPVGRWQHASDSTEIVLESKIKLTPSGNWGGTGLGGSAGYGSMTTTRIVAEPTPKRVVRSMTLTIGGDGRFEWTITRRFPDTKGCMRTVRQHKIGSVSMMGGAMALAVQRGEERFAGCGNHAVTAITSGVERYSVSLETGTMTLSGSGGIRWQFRP